MKNFEYKKSLGQNFLIDQNIKKKIIDSIDLEEESLILEIGTGSGSLTKELIKLDASIISFEIDERLKESHEEINSKNLEIIYADFLKIDLKELLRNLTYKHLYFIANIPYYITTPIINKINGFDVDEVIIMIQKEAAQRLLALPNSKDYNYLNVILQYKYEISKVTDVSSSCFYPKPKVDSTVIKMKKRKLMEEAKNADHFYKLVKESFKYKRKNLKNNLKDYNLKVIEETLKKQGKDLTYRAENLSLSEFINISNALN